MHQSYRAGRYMLKNARLAIEVFREKEEMRECSVRERVVHNIRGR